MNKHPVNQLHDFFFERLTAETHRQVAAHVATCSTCKRRLDAFDEAVNKVPVMTPAPALRERLFQSVNQLERFSPFARRLGELIAFSTNDARRALHAFADVDSWPLQPLPGMRALPLSLGPPDSPVRAILACFEPTSRVPLHRHIDNESIFVFQGAFETTDGKVIRAGDELHSEIGSIHGIKRFLDDIECLCAIVNPDSIVFEEPPSAKEAS